jgi:hypothetical protein
MLSRLLVTSGWRSYRHARASRWSSHAPRPFEESPDIPGFYFANPFLSASEHDDMHRLMLTFSPGVPETFGVDVFAGLAFPSEVAMSTFEQLLLPIINRIPHARTHLAVGVVVLRYGPTGSLPMHMDAPEKYGEFVCTIGFGSAAVLQMQNKRVTPPAIHRILLEPGSAYLMSGDARYQWLHGIEGGREIAQSNGSTLLRSTRFALLLTPPRKNFNGPLYLRHPRLPGGGALVAGAHGGVVVDAGESSSAVWPLDRVRASLDDGSFPL